MSVAKYIDFLTERQHMLPDTTFALLYGPTGILTPACGFGAEVSETQASQLVWACLHHVEKELKALKGIVIQRLDMNGTIRIVQDEEANLYLVVNKTLVADMSKTDQQYWARAVWLAILAYQGKETRLPDLEYLVQQHENEEPKQ